MNLLDRLRGALKAFTMRFPLGSWVYLPRDRFDYAAAVDPYQSSVVMPVVQWIARTFPEAPLVVTRRGTDGTVEILRDHPLLGLIARPNPFYSGPLLWMATMTDWVVSGNAYWIKVRNGQGRPVELWWTPQSLIEPRYPGDGSAFISHYEYRPGRDAIRLDVQDVVHLRYGLDPKNPRKGLSPLGAVLRELFTDEEASRFSAALLRNLGIPGVVISPDGDGIDLTREDAEAIKADFASKFAGENRGRPMVLSARVKVQTLSFNPQQLELKTLRRLPEERVAAALGIPAIVAGLGAGLDRSTFANFAEAREAAYESNIIPTQRLMASELETQLLPDFGSTDGLSISFDLSGVRVLQEDQNRIWERVDMAVRGGWLTVGEGRALLGLSSGPEHDYYLRPATTIAVGATEALSMPSPAPATAAVAGRIEQKRVSDDAHLIARLHHERERLLDGFAADLSTAFQELGQAVLDLIAAQKDATDTWPLALRIALEDERQVELLLPPRPGERWFRPVFETYVQVIGKTTFGTVSDYLGVALAWMHEDPVVLDLIQRGGERITHLDVEGQTRAAIMAALRDGRAAGDGAEALARRIRGYVEGRFLFPGIYQRAYEAARARGLSEERAQAEGDRAARQYRSETIARTETGTAQNRSSIAAYRASAVVEKVRVFDGIDFDDACRAANGQVWTFEQADLNPLQHPRCTRAFAPVVRE